MATIAAVFPALLSPRHSGRYYAPFWTGRTYYRTRAFRPRFSIGLNIFAGYPVAYTYPYPHAYSVGRPPASTTAASSRRSNRLTPRSMWTARMRVVADFDGSRQPLTLTGGTHRIEIVEQGLAPLVFDVVVQPGSGDSYRGDLRPYSSRESDLSSSGVGTLESRQAFEACRLTADRTDTTNNRAADYRSDCRLLIGIRALSPSRPASAGIRRSTGNRCKV
mgnify:CR=1 FL=1